MKKVLITVLAEDFEDNSYFNYKKTMKGCPLQRAYMRAGLVKKGQGYTELSYHNCSAPHEFKVIHMFDGKIPIEDFTFELEIPES
jgi:hypothetical protein